MFRYTRILIPTDFTYCSFYAMKYAVALAKRYTAKLDLVHCVSTAPFMPWASTSYWMWSEGLCAQEACMCERAGARLRHLGRMIASEGIDVECRVIRGVPGEQIVGTARELKSELVVVGTHGRVGVEHALFGSVAEEVARHAPAPVLTIKHPEHEFIEFRGGNVLLRRVLYPTDFSEYSLSTLPYAGSLCREFEATLILQHVVEPVVFGGEYLPEAVIPAMDDPEYDGRKRLERIADELTGVKVEMCQSSGVPSHEIVRIAHDIGADLVVIPTHGRSGVARMLFGGVARKVLRYCRCPVMTVRPEMVPVRQQNASDADEAHLYYGAGV
ncbi:MAG: universal stress protein [FCB group bacterium]|jgi:nucleotide-binding universal stress UspA family protein|nr:universal stress protein [FCB group bacterium]